MHTNPPKVKEKNPQKAILIGGIDFDIERVARSLKAKKNTPITAKKAKELKFFVPGCITKSTPIRPIKISIHCLLLTLCFKNREPPSAIIMGVACKIADDNDAF